MSERKKVRWTIASARQNLPTLVTRAAREPQDIYRRNELVARVVGADSPAAQPAKPSAAELLARIQIACAEEDYELSVPPRVDRRNAMLAALSPKRSRRVGPKKKR